MPNRKHACVALAIVLATSVCGCVTLPPNSKPVPQDPWERWNRGVYKFNSALDRAVAKPVARTYVRAVPAPVRTGISNFLSNLRTPTVMINDALQGKFRAAASDLARFLLNSTVGVGGLLDPATQAGLDRNDEDFGQTLGHWGVHPGPFVELPLLGPSDVRDTGGRVVDAYTNPRQYVRNLGWRYGIYGLDLIDTRAGLLSLDDTLKNVYDPYAFIRDAYLQRRAYLISDGKVTDEPLVDPGADDPQEEKPAPVPEATRPPPQPTKSLPDDPL
jgi:phospholipid-binding lipoprotein MlaA